MIQASLGSCVLQSSHSRGLGLFWLTFFSSSSRTISARRTTAIAWLVVVARVESLEGLGAIHIGDIGNHLMAPARRSFGWQGRSKLRRGIRRGVASLELMVGAGVKDVRGAGSRDLCAAECGAALLTDPELQLEVPCATATHGVKVIFSSLLPVLELAAVVWPPSAGELGRLLGHGVDVVADVHPASGYMVK